MNLASTRRPLLLLLALALFGSGTAMAAVDTTTSTHTFFLRNDGADCGTGAHPFLADEAGTKDLGCGYIGGGPFGEVFNTAGVDTAKVYVTETPFALKLDALRNVDGKITITPYAIVNGDSGSGVGQVIVDVAASAATAGGEIIDLGAVSSTVTANPVASKQRVPFSVDIPDALHGTDIAELHLKVNVRGVHAAHGFTELNGSSLVSVPFQPAVVATPAPTPAP